MFRHILTEFDCEAKWIIFIDADFFIADYNRTLQSIIARANSNIPFGTIGANCEMIAQDAPTTINSGMLLFRMSRSSEIILQNWVDKEWHHHFKVFDSQASHYYRFFTDQLSIQQCNSCCCFSRMCFGKKIKAGYNSYSYSMFSTLATQDQSSIAQNFFSTNSQVFQTAWLNLWLEIFAMQKCSVTTVCCQVTDPSESFVCCQGYTR